MLLVGFVCIIVAMRPFVSVGSGTREEATAREPGDNVPAVPHR